MSCVSDINKVMNEVVAVSGLLFQSLTPKLANSTHHYLTYLASPFAGDVFKCDPGFTDFGTKGGARFGGRWDGSKGFRRSNKGNGKSGNELHGGDRISKYQY